MVYKTTRIIAVFFFGGIFSMRLRRFEKLVQRIENYSKIIRYCSGWGAGFLLLFVLPIPTVRFFRQVGTCRLDFGKN